MALSAGLFVGSFLLGWTFAQRRKKTPLDPLSGATVRIRASGAVYRSRLVEVSADGWWIEAPLQRDSYVALHPAEHVTIEVPVNGGLLRAKTEVLRREISTHRILLAIPTSAIISDRRQWARQIGPQNATVEGEAVILSDLSSTGTRFSAGPKLDRGSRVRIDLAGEGRTVFGWVLEVGKHTRIRFEEALGTEFLSPRPQ